MNAVGIDVSKGKSTVAVLRPFGEIVLSPFDVYHNPKELSELVTLLKTLDGDTKVVMEYTGNYYLPIALFLRNNGLLVSVVNPILVKDYDSKSLSPEYDVVMSFFGVGSVLGSRLIAEIGDVSRFHNKKALIGFAGLDAPPYQSGNLNLQSRSISKRGSGDLRKTLTSSDVRYLATRPCQQLCISVYGQETRRRQTPLRLYDRCRQQVFTDLLCPCDRTS